MVASWTLVTLVAATVTAVGVIDIARGVADPLQLDGRATNDRQGVIELAGRVATGPAAQVVLPATGDDDRSSPDQVPTSSSPAAPADRVLAGPFDFDDGLQGWRTEVTWPGPSDTRWSAMRDGPDGRPVVGLTIADGRGRRAGYGDRADASLVSPVISSGGGSVIVRADTRWLVEPAFDVITLQWRTVPDGRWLTEPDEVSADATAGWVQRSWQFTPSGHFEVRFRLLSDQFASTATPDLDGAYFDGAWVESVSILSGEADVATTAAPHGPVEDRPAVVVAMLGFWSINPYHEQFRDPSPRAHRHPSTYLPGYPPTARALPLTLDAPSFEAAVEADAAVWAATEPDVLYWVPGTRLVALRATHPALTLGGCNPRCNLQEPNTTKAWNTQGTLAASRSVGRDVGACGDCLLAVYSGDDDTWAQPTVAAEHVEWIDVVFSPGVYWSPNDDPTGMGADRARHASTLASERLLFQGLVEHRPCRDSDLEGREDCPEGIRVDASARATPRSSVPGALAVGAHDNGHVEPSNLAGTHVVADHCGAWAADPNSLTRLTDATSGTEPLGLSWAAGHASRILLEARRLLGDVARAPRPDGALALGTPPSGITSGPLADGVLSAAELRALTLRTASPRPTGDASDGRLCNLASDDAAASLAWHDVPNDAPGFVNLGYGALDEDALDLALDVLAGTRELPGRPEEDTWFRLDAQARQRLYEVWSAQLLR